MFLRLGEIFFPNRAKRSRSRSEQPKSALPKVPKQVPRKAGRLQARFPRGSQARFPGRGSQARFPGTGSQATFPGTGSQAKIPSNSFPTTFPGTGSQARFPSKIPTQGSQEEARFPSKVPRNRQARFPRGSQAMFPRTGSQAKVSSAPKRATRASPVPQVPRLPRETKVDVTKCRVCNAKRRWMPPSARPAKQNAGGCHQVPRLPRKEKVNATKRHTCHAKWRGAPGDPARPSAPPEPAQSESGCRQVPRKDGV